MGAQEWDVYADEEPTEIHHESCEAAPDSWPTGDASAEVVHAPDTYAREGETFDVSCECLDPLLGSDRHKEGDA